MSLVNAKTGYGEVIGERLESGSTVFRGIPFAQPPIGKLRFHRPLKPNLWSEPLDCTKFKPIPIQGGPRPGQNGIQPVQSEDCLYLNIWTPTTDCNAGLPVIFWIPGGGFMTGNPYSATMHGEGLNKKGVILVTVMHRTGALGFMSHNWLKDENGQSGNYALYDLIAALNWVYENIGSFGGNPDNITIAGQSSGCVAVQTMLQVPQLKGKFKHAVMQSGRAVESGDLMDTADTSLAKGRNFAEQLGIKSKEELMNADPQFLFTKLKEMKKTRAEMDDQLNPGRFVYHVDGEAMIELLDDAAYNGINTDVDIMIGSTKDDGGPQNAIIRSNSCNLWCENQIALGYKPSYLYLFAREVPGENSGAGHGSEVAYQFGNIDAKPREYTKEDYVLSETMLSYLANFAKTGNPNAEGLPQWTPYTVDHNQRLRLDVNSIKEESIDILLGSKI